MNFFYRGVLQIKKEETFLKNTQKAAFFSMKTRSLFKDVEATQAMMLYHRANCQLIFSYSRCMLVSNQCIFGLICDKKLQHSPANIFDEEQCLHYIVCPPDVTKKMFISAYVHNFHQCLKQYYKPKQHYVMTVKNITISLIHQYN